MFSRRPAASESSSSRRVGKSSSKSAVGKTKRSYREPTAASKRSDRAAPKYSPPLGSTLTSAIITIAVGHEQRLFAAHEDVLAVSPFFAAICRGQFLESTAKRICLPDESPEVFSSLLEYLYKGDYFPRLLHNKRHNSWELEQAGSKNSNTAGGGGGGGGEQQQQEHQPPPPGNAESTIFHAGLGQELLKDTLVYCAADRYGLDELKRLALRKQGLQAGIQCSTILASARYAYDNTPDTDSKIRAHYLALIIRSRSTFKRSGTMQAEMERGGKLWFDLFVAMVNHMDDISSITRSPR